MTRTLPHAARAAGQEVLAKLYVKDCPPGPHITDIIRGDPFLASVLAVDVCSPEEGAPNVNGNVIGRQKLRWCASVVFGVLQTTLSFKKFDIFFWAPLSPCVSTCRLHMNM